MKTTSALKRLIGRVLIGVFVYTQLAVAAYACAGLPGMAAPGLNPSGPPFSAMGGHSQASVWMPATHAGAKSILAPVISADSMDSTQAVLCGAYGQYGQQNADTTPTPAGPAAVLTGFYTFPALHPYPERLSAAAGLRSTPLVVDPPHAILHCCLRT